MFEVDSKKSFLFHLNHSHSLAIHSLNAQCVQCSICQCCCIHRPETRYEIFKFHLVSFSSVVLSVFRCLKKKKNEIIMIFLCVPLNVAIEYSVTENNIISTAINGDDSHKNTQINEYHSTFIQQHSP